MQIKIRKLAAKLLLIQLVLILSKPSDIYSQIEEANIFFTDYRGVRQNNPDVTLLKFNSDTLTYLKGKSVNKIYVANIHKITLYNNSNFPSGLVIGTGIGALAGFFAVYLAGGAGEGASSGTYTAFFAFTAGVGGLIGGIIDGAHRLKTDIYFSGESLPEARKKMKLIFKNYQTGK